MADVPAAAPDLRPREPRATRNLAERLEAARGTLTPDVLDKAQVLIARALAAAGSGDLAQIVTLQTEFDELVP